MDQYLAFAKNLAKQGGKLIQDNFEANLAVEMKHDNTPVTEVDKAINLQIIESIQKTYPEHGLRGEEADYGSGQEEYQWVCDPLDGTQPFILGIPHSTCILGLTKAGEVLLAIVYNPYNDRLYHAVKGQGAYCNDQPMRVNNLPLKGGYVLAENSTARFADAIHDAGAKTEPVNGAGYSLMNIASGHAVATVKGKFDFHDAGVASLIVEEAGGKVTSLSGAKLDYKAQTKEGMVVSNGTCHEDLLKAIAPIA